MTTKNTNLKFSEVKKQAKLAHEQEQYELDNGSTISFYVTFPQTMIDTMFIEIQKSLQTKDESIEITDSLMQNFVLFHIIRKFTHFSKDLKATTFAGQLDEMTALIDFEIEGKSLFALIIDEIFLKEEVMKVFDGLKKAMSNVAFLEKFNKQVAEEISKLELQNKDLLKQYNPKSVVQ